MNVLESHAYINKIISQKNIKKYIYILMTVRIIFFFELNHTLEKNEKKNKRKISSEGN